MIGGSRGGKSEVRNWLDDLVAVEGIFGKEMDGAGLGEGIVLSDSRDAFKGDRKIVGCFGKRVVSGLLASFEKRFMPKERMDCDSARSRERKERNSCLSRFGWRVV
jgi:hypothetical protein